MTDEQPRSCGYLIMPWASGRSIASYDQCRNPKCFWKDCCGRVREVESGTVWRHHAGGGVSMSDQMLDDDGIRARLAYLKKYCPHCRGPVCEVWGGGKWQCFERLPRSLWRKATWPPVEGLPESEARHHEQNPDRRVEGAGRRRHHAGCADEVDKDNRDLCALLLEAERERDEAVARLAEAKAELAEAHVIIDRLAAALQVVGATTPEEPT